jgi:hypothetical protein
MQSVNERGAGDSGPFSTSFSSSSSSSSDEDERGVGNSEEAGERGVERGAGNSEEEDERGVGGFNEPFENLAPI